MKLVPMQKISVVVEAGSHERLLEALKTSQGVAYCAVQSVSSPAISPDSGRVLLELLVETPRARELLLRVSELSKDFAAPHVMIAEVRCMSINGAEPTGASSYVPREVRWGEYIISI